MEVLLVRHAHAGSKYRWDGDDRLRPLSRRGRSDARALVGELAPLAPTRIVSSPLVRCEQTVEPLADEVGVHIERASSLLPDAGSRAARFLLGLTRDGDADPARLVVCTHGETIDSLQNAFARRRVRRTLPGFLPGDPHEKGSVWILRFSEGRLTSARYLPPPHPAARLVAPGTRSTILSTGNCHPAGNAEIDVDGRRRRSVRRVNR